MDEHDEIQLDHPVHSALIGTQSQFAVRSGRVARYLPDVAPFLALPPDPTTEDWDDVARLVAPGTFAAILSTGDTPPDPWKAVRTFDVLQFVEEDAGGAPDPDAVCLTPADVPEMLEIVSHTEPGPFMERTIQLGRYVGVRRNGTLIAMAGERMHFDGWCEISAVCTAPAHRGQGLASQLVGDLCSAIHARSERAFLHVVSSNQPAIRLYEQLGFRARASRTITVLTR